MPVLSKLSLETPVSGKINHFESNVVVQIEIDGIDAGPDVDIPTPLLPRVLLDEIDSPCAVPLMLLPSLHCYEVEDAGVPRLKVSKMNDSECGTDDDSSLP